MVKFDQKETQDRVQLQGYCQHIDCQRFTKLGFSLTTSVLMKLLRTHRTNTQHGHSPYTAHW